MSSSDDRKDELKSREVAEAAREKTWRGQSFIRDLFHGQLNLDLLDPWQAPALERPAFREFHAALRRYRQRANLALGVHWCLLPGRNDRARDAAEIAAFCRGLGRVLVHVIPYNPGSAPIAPAPDEAAVARFVGMLRAHGLPVRRRVTKGRSVMAGCGQLGPADDSASGSVSGS